MQVTKLRIWRARIGTECDWMWRCGEKNCLRQKLSEIVQHVVQICFSKFTFVQQSSRILSLSLPFDSEQSDENPVSPLVQYWHMIMISANVEMNKTIFNWNTHQVISRPTVHSLDQPCMLCSGRRQKQVAEGVDQMGHMWCQICNQNFKVLTLCGCGRLDHPGDFNLDANSCTVFFRGV